MELLDAILQDRPGEAEASLRQWGVRDTRGAYENLRRILARLTPPEFGYLFGFIEAEVPGSFDPDRTLNNLERYQHISAGGLQPAWLARERPFLFRVLLDLFGFSQFLSDVLIRYPHYTAWLGDAGVLDEAPTQDELVESLERGMAPFTSAEKRQHAAVRWLRREFLRSGIRVMMQRSDEPQFTLELSRIAIAVIRKAVAESERPLRARFGRPLCETAEGEGAPVESGFCVVAMGKLGGMELNFSSDVDLAFVYAEEGQTEGVRDEGRSVVRARISNHEYFRRLSEGLIQFLTAPTEEGYLYRVDTRLRPDGAEGPLARSIGAFEVYYESSARPWERMALLKSRAIAGEPRLCEQFEALSRGLVFGLPMGPELIDEIRNLKQRIDAGVDSGDEAGREIKRGRGGIREIEFLIQALQLLYGARQKELRVRSTLELIPRLAARGHLNPDEAEQMAEDYIFLRRLEHRLQMVNLRQTHTLPEEAEELELLARRCGIETAENATPGEQLMERWENLSRRVHQRFAAFFGEAEEREAASEEASPVAQLTTLLLNGAPDRELIPLLEPYGLHSGGAIASLRRMAGRGRSVYLSSRAMELFPRVLPLLVEAAAQSPRPATAVLHLEALLSAFGSFGSLYEIFLSQPKLLVILSRAFGAASTWAQTLIAYPEFVDFLLDAEFLASEPTSESLLKRVERWAGGEKGSDPAVFAGALSRFRRFESVMTGLAETAGWVEFEEVTRRLTLVADTVLQAALNRAAGSDDHGGFVVLAMGKHGSRELNYFSDLDIVFAWDDRESPSLEPPAHERAVAVSSLLTQSTAEGTPYSIDTRLRPEGAGAPLAPPISRFVDYYATRAQLWEFQSFMKIRPAAGDRAFGAVVIEQIAETVARRLREEFDGDALAEGVRQMREKLQASVKVPSWVLCDFKKGPGGVMDLDFIAQYLQLCALKEGTSLIGCAPPAVFEWAGAQGRLEKDTADAMIRHYAFLRRLESRSRLLFETESSRAPSGGEKAESLARSMADLLPPEETDWQAYLMRIQRENRGWFDRVLRAPAAR